jgi:RHS repeat-associated protein
VTNVTDVVTINGNRSTNSLDLITHTLTLRSPAGRVRVLQTDGLGRVLSDQMPGLGLTSFSYEARGFLTNATVTADGQSDALTFQYDALGRLTNAAAPEGLTTSYSYDSANRPSELLLPGNQSVGLAVDSEGNLTGLTPPGRPAHQFSYDARNLPLTKDPPPLDTGPTPESLHFNLDRDVQRLDIPGGRSIELTYNPAGQLTNATYSSGDSYAASYHATNGLLTNLTYSAGASLAYQYAGGFLTNTIWSGSVTGRVGVALNADFRVTTLRVNNTNLATYKYDADGLLTNVGALVITRDPQNGLITGTALGGVTTVVQRNGFGEVTNYLAAFDGAPLLQMQYAYDRAGRITNKVETIQGTITQWDYSYEAAGRLQQVQRDGLIASSYTYDTNGNRRTWTTSAGSLTYNHDVQDRLTDYAGSGIAATFEHTGAGEWINRTLNGQSANYSYDEGGAIRQVTLPNTTQIQYVLDAEGRRVRRVISGVATNGWLWLGGLSPVAQLSGNNTVDAYFVPGLRPNVPDYMIRAGTIYRILADHLGSPRLVINTTDGAIAQRIDYDEFGVVVADTNPRFQPFGFAGGLYDNDTGLVRFGARDYDAQTGQWTDRDPILFAGQQTSLYAYVGNDPVNQSDPLGTGPNRQGSRPARSEQQETFDILTRQVPAVLNTVRHELENSGDAFTLDVRRACVGVSEARAQYLADFLPRGWTIKSVTIVPLGASRDPLALWSPHTHNMIEVPLPNGNTARYFVDNYLGPVAISPAGASGLPSNYVQTPESGVYGGRR